MTCEGSDFGGSPTGKNQLGPVLLLRGFDSVFSQGFFWISNFHHFFSDAMEILRVGWFVVFGGFERRRGFLFVLNLRGWFWRVFGVWWWTSPPFMKLKKVYLTYPFSDKSFKERWQNRSKIVQILFFLTFAEGPCESTFQMVWYTLYTFVWKWSHEAHMICADANPIENRILWIHTSRFYIKRYNIKW